MFTIEFDEDETLITILDKTDELEDVSILMYDDYCHIRQWNEKEQMFDVCTLSSEMYIELMKAWKLQEGAYYLDLIKK